MRLSTDAIGLPSGLTEALSALLPSAQLVQVSFREDLAPIVIMLRGHAVDAFAVGGADEYEALVASHPRGLSVAALRGWMDERGLEPVL